MKKFFSILLISILLFVLFLVTFIQSKISLEVEFEKPIEVEIPRGTAIDSIVSTFNKYGLLEPNWFFSYYIKYKKRTDNKHVHSGIFTLDSIVSNEDVIEQLFKGGKAKTIKVTIPEGLNNSEIAKILSSKLNISTDIFLNLCSNDSVLKSNNIKAESLIGYLLPETYDFYFNSNEINVLNKLRDAQIVFLDKNKEAIENSGKSIHQILTLASIVESETPNENEYEKVAGLYLNRLKLNMLLQADPTVQFALGYKDRVLYKDLEIDNPYNTYKYSGLPPGPINNPGKKAILSVLFPEKHDYLYMVAKGDGSRTHLFAKTNKEHLKNVAIYRRNKNNN